MSVSYQTVQWNPYKRRFDACLALGISLFMVAFFAISKIHLAGQHGISEEVLLMRAAGLAAIILLHLILCIGPLSRLDRRFLPLLYNRRHLGVSMFLLALVHSAVGLGFYHGFGRISPLTSVLTSNTQYRSVSAFPFETLGLLALAILFVMAATSHDFWLKNLSASVWKSLHMLVYLAWGLLILHVALGALQSERSPAYTWLLWLGVAGVATLHLVAGWKETRPGHRASSNWLDVCGVDDIADTRGKVVAVAGRERVAIFRNGQDFSAMSNVCAHQGGPLGEGRIVNGCVTCPWHGYQYQPHDGCAPPPFTEKLPTYQLRIQSGRILLNLQPLPPGAAVAPARAEAAISEQIND